MTRLTHNSAVVLIPPEELWAPIQAIRREHDRQFRRWMPHVTLLYPFLPREAFVEVEPRLSEACRGVSRFALTLREFRLFRHRRGSCTLWLAPEPREQLAALHAALAEAFPECAAAPAPPFEPHLSVGQARTAAEAQALASRLQAAWRPMKFAAVATSLIWRHDPPDDVFRVERRFPFRSTGIE